MLCVIATLSQTNKKLPLIQYINYVLISSVFFCFSILILMIDISSFFHVFCFDLLFNYKVIFVHNHENRINKISESDKNTRKSHTQESKEVRPFPAGDHKAARNT